MAGDRHGSGLCPQEHEPRQPIAVQNPDLHKTFTTTYYLTVFSPGFSVVVRLLMKTWLSLFSPI